MRKTRTRHDEPDLTPTSDLRPPRSGRARPPGGTLFSRSAFLKRSSRSSRSVRSGRARPPGGPLRFGGRRDDKTTRQQELPQLSFGTTGRAFPSFRQPVVPSSSRSGRGRLSSANGLLDPWKIRPKDPSSRPLRLWASGGGGRAFDLLSAGSVARATSTCCCSFGAFFRFSRLHKSFIIFRCLKSHGATHGNGCSPHNPNSKMQPNTQSESENSGKINQWPAVSSIAGQPVRRIGEDGPSTASCLVGPDPKYLTPQMEIITEAPSETAKK